MAILKNILESGTDLKLLFDRDEYITDPLKTKSNLIGALCCSAQNFPNVCRALKRHSGQQNSKMLRHFVVSISPADESKLSDKELLNAAREVASFFKDCYVKYAIHTNTPHTHFHILVCNTKISNGKQISMSDSDLRRFKEYSSSVFRRFGLKPIEKLDKSDDALEINEDLFPKALTQEERVNTLYYGDPKPILQKLYYGNNASAPHCVNNTVNVIIPQGTQGTLFQGRNGTPCISFKPYLPYYGNSPVRYYPQNSPYYGSTDVPTQQFPEPEVPSERVDDEPDWVKDGNVLPPASPVISDGLICPIVIVNEAKAKAEAVVKCEAEVGAEDEADYETEYEADYDAEYEADYDAEYETEWEAEPKNQQLTDPFVILVDPFVFLKK